MRVDLKHILCATDLSDFANAAVFHGIAMAEAFDAKLFVCHIMEMHTAGIYAEACIDPLDLQNRHMDFIRDRFDHLIGDRPVDWEPLVGLGYPPDEIAKMSETHRIDLVITATHGRSGIKRLILGSVTERLMRTLSCPSLVVSSREPDLQDPHGSAKPGFPMRRIMVGCDFSPDSRLAFEYAQSFAQEFQAELHLVHVMDPGAESGSLTHPPVPRGQGKRAAAARNRERLADRLARSIPEEVLNWCVPVTAILEGRPHEEILRYAAAKEIDMILLGIRGHGLMETYLVGSTTDRVVRQSPCPVLSARPIPQIETGTRAEGRVTASAPGRLEADFELFAAEARDGVVLIRLKKDLMHRAMDLNARDALLDYLNVVDRDPEIRAAVIMGSPDKTGSEEYFRFYDRLLKTEMDRNAIHRLYNVIDQIVLALAELDKIVVHADCGRVISLYLNLSLACDCRIVAEDTVFQNPCIEMGMIPKGGGPFFLARMLGVGRASDILLARRDISAREALALGIVDSVVESESLEETAWQKARQYAGKPATSLKGVKRLLNHSKKELRDYLEFENQELLGIIGSPQLPTAEPGAGRQ